jgi:carbonic anhydrase
LSDTTVMRAAWARGQDVTVHGGIYRIADGLVNDLHVSCAGPDDFAKLAG